MNDENLIPVLLLLLFGIALMTGVAVISFVRHWRRHRTKLSETLDDHLFQFFTEIGSAHAAFFQRPASWLVVRSHNLDAVQSALALNNPKPCRWVDGMATERRLFIAPPVRGWVLVLGSGLPDPHADIDACFRFVTNLSRKLGEVQFFQADPVVGHHAWVQAEAGRVQRGYAWADETLWNQGAKTDAEMELGMKCYPYFERPEPAFDQPDFISLNVEKVPLLAARWSLDPCSLDERAFEHALGIAGDL